MKAILMSIKSKWITKIHDGEKNIEIRIRFPKDYVGWVYIYCTENSEKIYDSLGKTLLNGKVPSRFWCDNVDELMCEFHDYELFGEDTVYQGIDLIYRDEDDPELYDHYNLVSNEDGDTNEEVYENNAFLKRCCLTLEDFKKYAKKKETLYDIHITKLEIFDMPKEISEFENYNMVREVELNADYYKGFDTSKITVVKKAPQSWCYVEVDE